MDDIEKLVYGLIRGQIFITGDTIKNVVTRKGIQAETVDAILVKLETDGLIADMEIIADDVTIQGYAVSNIVLRRRIK